MSEEPKNEPSLEDQMHAIQAKLDAKKAEAAKPKAVPPIPIKQAKSQPKKVKQAKPKKAKTIQVKPPVKNLPLNPVEMLALKRARQKK